MAKEYEFSKASRLLKRDEFLNIKNGKRKVLKQIVICWKENPHGLTRLGITISRKVAKAVQRNHFKRRVRELFRCYPGLFPRAADIVIIARRGAGELRIAQLKKLLESF